MTITTKMRKYPESLPHQRFTIEDVKSTVFNSKSHAKGYWYFQVIITRFAVLADITVVEFLLNIIYTDHDTLSPGESIDYYQASAMVLQPNVFGNNLVDDRSILKVLQSPFSNYDEFYENDYLLPEFEWLESDFGTMVKKLHSQILWCKDYNNNHFAEYNIDSRDHKYGNWVKIQ